VRVSDSSYRILVALLMAAVVGVSSASGRPPLGPDELLLVYNRDDPRSRELAEYYARVRSVPDDRLCPVRANTRDEEISREHFERYIRRPVRDVLETQAFGRDIRCIVLFYGLPIRVGEKKVNPAEQRLAKQWQEKLEAGLAHLVKVTGVLENIAGLESAQTAPAPPDGQSLNVLLARYERARVKAGERVDELRKAGQGQEEFVQVVGVMEAVEGVARILTVAGAHANMASEQAAQLEAAVEQLRANDLRINELMAKGLTDPARDEARQLILSTYGLAGFLRSLTYDIIRTRTDETVASVDSELSLVWWDDYMLYRWVPNTLSWRVRANPAMLADVTPRQRQTPVMMTARIDGPTMTVARRIIDDAIAVEKTGLSGVAYLDARGLRDDQGLAEYDESLRDLAGLLERTAGFPVKLDNAPAVFAPGACPDAALYCGWYSLRQYVDAFDFVRGAVGYHLASFEAISIRSPLERGWVKGLLEDGVAATLGSVAEPYLHAFPRPVHFFGLLLTGRFTLAECYAYTADLNSWMMLLVGDPLYRPFAVNPRLTVEQVFPLGQIPPEFRAAETKPAP